MADKMFGKDKVSPVSTTLYDSQLEEIAELMEKHNCKRSVVIQDLVKLGLRNLNG